jgi:hypothetical protein
MSLVLVPALLDGLVKTATKDVTSGPGVRTALSNASAPTVQNVTTSLVDVSVDSVSPDSDVIECVRKATLGRTA